MLSINSVMFSLELLQLVSQGPRAYIDFWNTINFISSPLLIGYSVHKLRELHGYTEHDEDGWNVQFLLGMVLVLLNGIS